MKMTSSTTSETREHNLFDSNPETSISFLENRYVNQLPWGLRQRIPRNTGLKFVDTKSNASVMFEDVSSYSYFEDVIDSHVYFLDTTIVEQLMIESQTLEVLRGAFNGWESIIMQKENLLKFNTISQGDLTLVLNDPLEVEPSFEDGEYFLRIPEFNIYISAPTLGEASDELQSDIIWLWREYVDEQDEDFTFDAKQLRERLQSLVKEVR